MAGVFFMFTADILTIAAVTSSFPLTLTLERAFPMNHGMDLDQLRARDTLRHGRLLKSSNGVVDFFHVYGTTFPPVGLTPAAIFSGSVAAPAMVVHRLLSNSFLITVLSITDFFPQVNLNFAGGASLDLRPQDYLIQPIDGGSVWCIGFQKIKSQRVTILGDLLLKDKIVVYDLDGQRIGWDDYDCSLPVNVCTAIGTSKHVNTGKTSESTCLHDGLITSFFVTLILCFVYF